MLGPVRTLDLATVVKLTRLDVALPFIVASLLIIAGALVATLTTRRVEDILTRWAQEQGVEKCLPDTFKPAFLAQMSQWTIDTAQVLTGLLAPLVALVLLHKHGGRDQLQLAYLAVFVAALAIFTRFLLADPAKYGSKLPRGITPVVVITLLLNIAGSVAAYVIGP